MMVAAFLRKACQGVHLPVTIWKPGGVAGWWAGLLSQNRLSSRGKGDSLPRGSWQVWRVRMASCPFAVSEMQKLLTLLKLNVLGRALRVINRLNCAVVFASRQIPPPYREQ